MSAAPAAEVHRDPGGPPAILTEAVDDAQLLLAYAAEHGKGVDAETTRIIIGSRRLRDGAGNEDGAEVAFWLAFDKLARALAPVTVLSLKTFARLEPDGSLSARLVRRLLGTAGGQSAAQGAMRRIRRWALLTLVVLVASQIYWVVGSTLTRDIPGLLKEVRDRQVKRDELQRRLGAAAASAAELIQLDAEIINQETPLQVNYEILQAWNNVWQAERLRRFFGPLPAPTTGTYQNLLKELSTAQFVLSALQQYLLPLLYGLLGAVTYVLRTLAADIKARSYTPDAEVGYRLRMVMGALGGLVVSSFVAADTSAATLKTLSPFALAFATGYSVEILFAILDRFITAFSRPEGTGPAPPRR
jgi:hypothetical protein